MHNLIYSFHVDLAGKENIMEQFLDENVYIIDLGEVNTAPEIIFQLSSILDKEEAKNIAFSELYTRCQSIISSISSCGVRGKILRTNELIHSFYILVVFHCIYLPYLHLFFC